MLIGLIDDSFVVIISRNVAYFEKWLQNFVIALPGSLHTDFSTKYRLI
jgi:hypothetical protein